jgi:hypothetical protein
MRAERMNLYNGAFQRTLHIMKHIEQIKSLMRQSKSISEFTDALKDTEIRIIEKS